ncbi:ester cyclase [Actinokineospora sp. G85]|uniref:ester cyclase n=1 Tax=Actinokineospora sp. G85 TaxID=3406626 RepID=UPI003C74869F
MRSEGCPGRSSQTDLEHPSPVPRHHPDLGLAHLVDGDWLSAHLIDTGTHTGPFLGVPATGRTISAVELAIYPGGQREDRRVLGRPRFHGPRPARLRCARVTHPRPPPDRSGHREVRPGGTGDLGPGREG